MTRRTQGEAVPKAATADAGPKGPVVEAFEGAAVAMSAAAAEMRAAQLRAIEGATAVDQVAHGFVEGMPDPVTRPALRVKRLTPTAIIPDYATAGAAAFDLHADGLEDAPVKPMMGRAVDIGTGLAFAVPEGWALLIFSRSGHAWKHDVRLSNCVGVIDPDYRGEVRVRLAADSLASGLRIRQGDRIAQAMLVQAPRFALVEVDELDATQRGEGGFGSTGDAA